MAVPVNHGCSSEEKNTQRSGILFHHCRLRWLPALNLKFSQCNFSHHGTLSWEHQSSAFEAVFGTNSTSTILQLISNYYSRNFKPIHKLLITGPLKMKHQYPVGWDIFYVIAGDQKRYFSAMVWIFSFFSFFFCHMSSVKTSAKKNAPFWCGQHFDTLQCC